jgi:hypothetical protein
MTDTQEEVVVNGKKFILASVKTPLESEEEPLYPKSTRDTMSTEKLNELFDRAVKRTQTKYTALDVKITDPDKLEDTYDLESAIEKTYLHHVKYDLHDVFTVVILDKTGRKPVSSVNLYKDYSSVSVAKVAASNEWYATMMAKPARTHLIQDLKITYEHLINNTDEHLVSKINETYSTYPAAKRGGPLFFKLMMDILQDSSDATAEYLIATVKKLKLTDFDGENVDKVVSLIRGAVKRLTNLRTSGGKKAELPDDFITSLLTTFQSSSVPLFNVFFAQIDLNTRIVNCDADDDDDDSGAVVRKPTLTVKRILRYAETQYRQLCAQDKWTGVVRKTNESAFAAKMANHKSGPICFNCGGSHLVKDCPQPKNQDRIKAQKKLFMDKKKKDGKDKSKPTKNERHKNGKWKPPTEEEKKNQSRREIDGKLYYYHYKDKRWKLVDQNDSVHSNAPTVPTSNVSLTSAPVPVITPVPSAAISAVTTDRELAIVNATRQIEHSLRGLMSQF